MIFEKIFFCVISIALFVIMFLKMMRKNDMLNLTSLILQAIGIGINFISLIFRIELNLFFVLLTYLMWVIVPIVIIVCEYNEINLMGKIYMVLAKTYMLRKDTKDAKKILIALIEKNDNCVEAHKMLAEIYEQELHRISLV